MPKKILTQEALKDKLSYDKSNGIFIRKSNPYRRIGTIDITRSGNTYLRIMVNGKIYRAHRLVWLYIYGSFPKYQVDHIDGNGLNNKLSNLRDVQQTKNQRNAKQRTDNKSGITGVSWCNRSNKWVSTIFYSNSGHHLGYFNDIWSAICARKSAEYKNNFHANHGRLING